MSVESPSEALGTRAPMDHHRGMKSTTVGTVALLSAIAGGVIGSLVTLALRGAPEEPPASREEAEHYEAELQRLRGELQSVRREVGLLTDTRHHASPSLPSSSAGSGPAGGNSLPPDDPSFEEAVRDVVRRMDGERGGSGGASHPTSTALADRLALSEEQKRQFQRINLDHLTAIRDLRLQQDEGTPLPRSEWRKRMGELRDKADASLRAILTPEQLRTYDGLDEGDRVGGGSGWQRLGHSPGAGRQH